MKLQWGAGPPMYDLGVDQGVLYLDGTGVPWNGLVTVDELETGSVSGERYFDGIRADVSEETGDFQATVSAYTYPDAFAEYNGFSERDIYRRFGFSYRTQHGVDSYKLHLVYNVLVRDDSRSWATLGALVDPSLFAWNINSAAEPIPGASPAGRLSMEATRDPSVLAEIEDILYGTDATEPRLPSPAEIVELYEAATIMRVTQNGDGTYTVSGPDSMVQLNGDGSFTVNAPTVQHRKDKKGSFVLGSF